MPARRETQMASGATVGVKGVNGVIGVIGDGEVGLSVSGVRRIIFNKV